MGSRSQRCQARDAAAMAAVGALFRRSRETLRLTQEQVAALTGGGARDLSRSAIGAIERGEHQPGLLSLIELTKVLRIDPRRVIETAQAAGASSPELSGLSRARLERQARDLFSARSYHEALVRYDMMLRLARLEPDSDAGNQSRVAAEIELRRAEALHRCGAPLAARDAAERAIVLADRTADLQARIFLVLSEIHLAMAQPVLALITARRTLELADRPAVSLRARASLSAGRALEHAGRLREARGQYEEARELFRESNDAVGVISAEGGLGSCHASLRQLRAARRAFQRAILLARRHGLPVLEARWLVDLGRTALAGGCLDEAEDHALAALRLARPREQTLIVFRAEWLRHLISERAQTRPPDRHRFAALRKLIFRLDEDRADPDVRAFLARVRHVDQERRPEGV